MSHSRTLYFSIAFLVFALGGAWFAGVSTYDFILHLDGQVHSIACSYTPGLSARDISGSSGCYAVMMSPWSSVLRSSTWAGIPIALPGLAVFLFLAFIGVDFLIQKKYQRRSESLFLLIASALPLFTSIFYFVVSVHLIGDVCKLCIGIYIASLGAFVCALLQTVFADCDIKTAEPRSTNAVALSAPSSLPRLPFARYAMYAGEGVLFVGLALVIYLGLKPDYEDRNCGELVKPTDRLGIMLASSGDNAGTPAIEVLDPLCPACNVFRSRLNASDLNQSLARKTVLFPLDSECNWMLKEPLHHGACMVSRAVICARNPEAVIDWSLTNNTELRELAKSAGVATLRAKIVEKFPEVSDCMDTPEIKTKLNQSLRWIVANSLSILTPQLFINNRKLCDEDMDLGLEYGLGRLLADSDKQ
jgi:uncharacterized membrane protein